MGGENSVTICGPQSFDTTNLLRCGKLLCSGIGNMFLNLQMRLGQGSDGRSSHISLEDLRSGLMKLVCLFDSKIDSEDEDRAIPHTNTLWFRIASNSDATDGRDRLYGMLNLMPAALRTLVVVDYTAGNKYINVMIQFAAIHIKSTNSLQWALH